jgi:hypothetical protein
MNLNCPARSPAEEDALLDLALASYVLEIPDCGPKGRRIGGGDPKSSMDAILHEASQTLLARKLLFQSENDDTLTLEVADRHVRTVVFGSSGEIVGSTDLDPMRLDVTSICAVISEFVHVADTIFVRPQRGSVSALGTPGFSVYKLQQHHQRPDNSGAGPFERFMKQLGPTLKAVLLTDESGAEKACGDVATLTQLRAAWLAEGSSVDNDDDQMILLTEGRLNSEPGNLSALLFAQSNQAQLLCGFNASDALAVATCWISETCNSPSDRLS